MRKCHFLAIILAGVLGAAVAMPADAQPKEPIKPPTPPVAIPKPPAQSPAVAKKKVREVVLKGGPMAGKTVKLGRKEPPGLRSSTPKFHLHDYILKSLPAPPATVDYSGKSLLSLSNVYLNDTLGDCVIAGGYHVRGVVTGQAGKEFVATAAQITADYGAIGGYVPGDPSTDNGCDMPTAMNYWMKNGFAGGGGGKLYGWVAIDPTNQNSLKQGAFIFENLYMGLGLPDAWINQDNPTGNGFVWDVAGAADENNGHCIMAYGYSSKGILVDTWGMTGTVTWAAVAKYMAASQGGEMYTLVCSEEIAAAQATAPNGINWSQLSADFVSLGGSAFTPPTPPTPPGPTPPGPPTPPSPPAPVAGISLTISGPLAAGTYQVVPQDSVVGPAGSIMLSAADQQTWNQAVQTMQGIMDRAKAKAPAAPMPAGPPKEETSVVPVPPTYPAVTPEVRAAGGFGQPRKRD